MKIIQNILQKTKASKLCFSIAVVFMVILNVSSAEAKSLKKGDVFALSDKHGKFIITVASSVELEFEKVNMGDGSGGRISLGKYTIDGDRVRVVFSALGNAEVMYLKITSVGLVDEKEGKVYYSKAVLAAEEKSRKAAATAARFTFIGGEVTDKKTGLIWRRCTEGMNYSGGTCTGTGSKFTYAQALEHAAAQASSTGKAWRVPEKIELLSIDNGDIYRRIDSTTFLATPTGFFWSASPYVDDSERAWAVTIMTIGGDTSRGDAGIPIFRSFTTYVRLVRAGQ